MGREFFKNWEITGVWVVKVVVACGRKLGIFRLTSLCFHPLLGDDAQVQEVGDMVFVYVRGRRLVQTILLAYDAEVEEVDYPVFVDVSSRDCS